MRFSLSLWERAGVRGCGAKDIWSSLIICDAHLHVLSPAAFLTLPRPSQKLTAPMPEPKENVLMEKIVSLCKRRGFIFQSSEIYGGINGFWDYGPLGAELKRNVKELWWRSMTQERDDVVGLEASIIMHPKIWEASGHVNTFADPMCDCLLTKKRFRADQVEPQSGNAYH